MTGPRQWLDMTDGRLFAPWFSTRFRRYINYLFIYLFIYLLTYLLTYCTGFWPQQTRLSAFSTAETTVVTVSRPNIVNRFLPTSIVINSCFIVSCSQFHTVMYSALVLWHNNAASASTGRYYSAVHRSMFLLSRPGSLYCSRHMLLFMSACAQWW